jgi:hypothetical protein
LVSDPTLIASTSSDTDQWLERLETTVGDIRELLTAMTTHFEQLSEDRRSSMEVGSNNQNKNKGERSTRTAAGMSGLIAPKIAKLDFPKYGGKKVQQVGFVGSSNFLSFMVLLKRRSCR